MEGNKKLSWKLGDIAFSKIELWFTKKPEGVTKECNSSSKMPGFSMTWSASNGSNMSKVLTVSDIPRGGELENYKKSQIGSLYAYLTNLEYTILDCRKVNMTTKEIWNMVRVHKRELAEGNRISCYLGQVKNDHNDGSNYRQLFDLRKKIQHNRQEVAYKKTADDYILSFEIMSYLLFCEREQIEMSAFYNNLFLTANPRTILQTTVNNIQQGAEEPDTMVALHQIYKMLAKKMELKLPYILQGFLDSNMLNNVDKNVNIFMNKDPKDDFKLTAKVPKLGNR